MSRASHRPSNLGISSHHDFSGCEFLHPLVSLSASLFTFALHYEMDLSLFCQNNLLYTQESLSKYQPGGNHPVHLGDTFDNGRYKIHHKLGWGGFSTVWLVNDRESAYHLNQFYPAQLTARQPKSMGFVENPDREFMCITRATKFKAS